MQKRVLNILMFYSWFSLFQNLINHSIFFLNKDKTLIINCIIYIKNITYFDFCDIGKMNAYCSVNTQNFLWFREND